MRKPRDISNIVPDPTALRALAHPVRLKMLGILRIEGPATATTLAERLELNTGATSYHLRQLAQHGFIEEAPDRGNRRDRWWRSKHETTTYFEAPTNPDAFDSSIAFAQAALTAHVQTMQRAQDEFTALPPERQEASTTSDFTIRLTASDAKALKDKLLDLLWEAMRKSPSPEAEREADVETYTVMLHAFPYPGLIGSKGEGSA